MPERGRKPTLAAIAEELALECQASARENAALALELNRLANRFLDLSRAYAGTGNHAPERLAS
jgi:hypothetical protein